MSSGSRGPINLDKLIHRNQHTGSAPEEFAAGPEVKKWLELADKLLSSDSDEASDSESESSAQRAYSGRLTSTGSPDGSRTCSPPFQNGMMSRGNDH